MLTLSLKWEKKHAYEGGGQASMTREEERNHTVQEFLVQDRSCRKVMNKGCKETALPMSKTYSWKAPEEPYKVARAAIAASALSISGVQQPEGRKGQICNSLSESYV